MTTREIGTTTAFGLLSILIGIPSDEIIAKIYVENYVMESCESPKGLRTITESPKWAEFTLRKKRICIFVKKTKQEAAKLKVKKILSDKKCVIQ